MQPARSNTFIGQIIAYKISIILSFSTLSVNTTLLAIIISQDTCYYYLSPRMKTSNVHHQPKHRPPPTVDNSPESVDGASKLISRPDQDILIVIYARYNMPWPGWGGEPAISRTHDSHCWPDTFYFYKHSVPETQQLTSDGVE